MASRMILLRFSRNGGSSLNRLISVRPDPRLCVSNLVSSSPIEVPVYQFSSFSSFLNGTFQRKGFSSKACDKEAELTREEFLKLLVGNDKFRGYAEMKNVMNLTKREVKKSQKFAIKSFAKDLLDIADTLDRASSVINNIFAKTDEKKVDKAALLLETLLEGVEMTNKQLSKVLKKFGVEKYDSQNKTFDLQRHNAVYEFPDPSKPPGTVAAVIKVPVKQFSSFPGLLEEKQKELETMKYKLCRAGIEDALNKFKRVIENSKKLAIQSFANDILDVADNLERAATIVKKIFANTDVKEVDKAALLLENLLEGVEMTTKQLYEVFKKFGVEKYDALNETFDPLRHYAVYEFPDSYKSPGTVAVVIKDGYMLHGRVLRLADVGVTKSPEGSSD